MPQPPPRRREDARRTSVTRCVQCQHETRLASVSFDASQGGAAPPGRPVIPHPRAAPPSHRSHGSHQLLSLCVPFTFLLSGASAAKDARCHTMSQHIGLMPGSPFPILEVPAVRELFLVPFRGDNSPLFSSCDLLTLKVCTGGRRDCLHEGRREVQACGDLQGPLLPLLPGALTSQSQPARCCKKMVPKRRNESWRLPPDVLRMRIDSCRSRRV